MTVADHSAGQSASALFLANRLPWPLIDGWSRRTFHIVRQLAVQWPVRLIVFSDGDQARLDAAQTALGANVQIESVRRRPMRRLRGLTGSLFRDRPFHVAADSDASFARAVTQALRTGDVRLIGCAGVNMAGYFALDHEHRALHIVDTHNIDSLVVDRFASLISDPFRRAFATLSGPQMRAWEESVFTDADLVVVCSTSEIALARQIAPNATVQCVPNGADVLPAAPHLITDRNAPSLLFFGRLDYFPNIDALQFLRSTMIAPLRAQLPGFRVRIVGAGDVASLTALFRDVPEVEVIGFVDSLTDELARADAVIVPLRTGGGTRLKILEAMAAGRPVVSTTIGAEGIDATDGVNIVLRDEPDAFVQAIGEVVRDAAFANRIGKAARQLIVDRYSWDGIGHALRESVTARLVAKPAAMAADASTADGRSA